MKHLLTFSVVASSLAMTTLALAQSDTARRQAIAKAKLGVSATSAAPVKATIGVYDTNVTLRRGSTTIGTAKLRVEKASIRGFSLKFSARKRAERGMSSERVIIDFTETHRTSKKYAYVLECGVGKQSNSILAHRMQLYQDEWDRGKTVPKIKAFATLSKVRHATLSHAFTARQNQRLRFTVVASAPTPLSMSAKNTCTIYAFEVRPLGNKA